MSIPMRLRKRDATTGRWPALTELPKDKLATEKPRKRHTVKAGGSGRRISGNTKRGITGGQARFNRGRKRVNERRTHGGVYGTAAQAYPQAPR